MWSPRAVCVWGGGRGGGYEKWNPRAAGLGNEMRNPRAAGSTLLGRRLTGYVGHHHRGPFIVQFCVPWTIVQFCAQLRTGFESIFSFLAFSRLVSRPLEPRIGWVCEKGSWEVETERGVVLAPRFQTKVDVPAVRELLGCGVTLVSNMH